MKIAMIGLGAMGSSMAANLVRCGHSVCAFDLSAGAAARAMRSGCKIASTAAEAVQGAEAVVTMLPGGEIVQSVYFGEVFGSAPQSALLVDCSTIEVGTARKLGKAAAGAGYKMVDAPASGNIAAASASTLTFTVGGSDAGFTRAQPILLAMGRAVIHAGESGSGQAVAICNNMLLGSTIAAACEAVRLAERLGLDPLTYRDVAAQLLGEGPGADFCWAVPHVVDYGSAESDSLNRFTSTLMLTDLRLALEAAWTTNARIPMGEQAEELYSAFVGAGKGNVDFSGIVELL